MLTLPVELQTVPTRAERFAAALRGFGPIGLLATGVIFAGNSIVVPLSAIFVLLWARLSGTPYRDIGFVRPQSWPRTIVAAILVGVALKFVMKAMVMPLLGADPINQAVRHLTGNTAALPLWLYAGTVGAGFGEETLFRGYLFERLQKLLGGGVGAKIAIVIFTSAFFGAAHYGFQGVPGVQQATIVGLIFGTIFAITGRLWFLIVVHAAFNVTALLMIYWGLERDVAHLIFR
jgi:membrane protease YdiL (CAAX protease family)